MYNYVVDEKRQCIELSKIRKQNKIKFLKIIITKYVGISILSKYGDIGCCHVIIQKLSNDNDVRHRWSRSILIKQHDFIAQQIFQIQIVIYSYPVSPVTKQFLRYVCTAARACLTDHVECDHCATQRVVYKINSLL